MKKALIVAGGWDGHYPVETGEAFSKILNGEGFETEISFSLDAFADVEKLKEYDLIVPHWTMGEIPSEYTRNVSEAVASGVGLAGCHGGMCDAFRSDTDWQFMTGAQWVAHPGNSGITYTVHFLRERSELVRGIEDFTLTSEQYYIHVDPCVNVLATTVVKPMEGMPFASNGEVVMPAVYTKMWGNGRVYYISVGHTADIWDMPSPKEAIRRGFVWAARDRKEKTR